MSAPSAKMLVSIGERSALVQIAGRANFTSSVDFKSLLDQLLQRGYTCFVLDLTECVLMDSTFLGVLAGFGLKLNSPQTDKIERTIQLFNPNGRISELLENLGVLHLFHVTEGPVKTPDGAPVNDVQTTHPSREEVTRTCLEAHKTLMDINPENVGRFKDVTAFLADDLKKMKSGS
ncbi:MAG TPA: STAS domain-containing protein [Verrucomicrobiae bacterium]|nr:STAS domain-containing protein [Verrucomicrobiae bacterium]